MHASLMYSLLVWGILVQEKSCAISVLEFDLMCRLVPMPLYEMRYSLDLCLYIGF